MGIRRPTIIAWLKSDIYTESRGWKCGIYRTNTDEQAKRIISLKQDRIDRKAYFFGSPYIRMDYAKKFPCDPLPSLWFFDKTVRGAGLQTHEPKKRTKGQSIVSRLKFPIRSIVALGRIQQAADFIGKKYIAGQSGPVNIFSTSYYQWIQLYQVWRVYTETAECAIQCLARLWTTTPIADVMRVDNGMTFRGTGAAQAHIGRFLKFLLNTGVTPLFSSQYQSYTNPHIEGHNRTFTEKLWTKHHFTSEEEIDRECERFNSESSEYYEFAFKERLQERSLRYMDSNHVPNTAIMRSTKRKKICFIRFVQRWKEEADTCGIVVLNRFIIIPAVYLNQYVFAQINLETVEIQVCSEHDGISSEILRKPFPYTL